MAGARPTRSAVAAVMPAVNSSARGLIASVVLGGSVAPSSAWIAWSAHIPSSVPTAPAATARIRLSMTNWRTIRRVRGPERSPDRDLLLPRGQASEEERRDIGAGDQQHEPDRAQQCVEGGLQVADQGADVRQRLAGVVGVEPGGKLLAGTAADRSEIGRRLLERDAALEPGDRLRIAGARLNLQRREAADLEDARRHHLYLLKGRRQVAAA